MYLVHERVSTWACSLSLCEYYYLYVYTTISMCKLLSLCLYYYLYVYTTISIWILLSLCDYYYFYVYTLISMRILWSLCVYSDLYGQWYVVMSLTFVVKSAHTDWALQKDLFAGLGSRPAEDAVVNGGTMLIAAITLQIWNLKFKKFDFFVAVKRKFYVRNSVTRLGDFESSWWQNIFQKYDVIVKLSLTMLSWDKVLWLDVSSDVTNFNQ